VEILLCRLLVGGRRLLVGEELFEGRVGLRVLRELALAGADLAQGGRLRIDRVRRLKLGKGLGELLLLHQLRRIGSVALGLLDLRSGRLLRSLRKCGGRQGETSNDRQVGSVNRTEPEHGDYLSSLERGSR